MKTPKQTESTPAATMYLNGDPDTEDIDMTRDEYIVLKQHLATMRGLTPAPPAEPAAKGENDLVAWFAEMEEARSGGNTPAEEFICHLVMHHHYKAITPDETAECLKEFRKDFDGMICEAREFIAKYPQTLETATSA